MAARGEASGSGRCVIARRSCEREELEGGGARTVNLASEVSLAAAKPREEKRETAAGSAI